MSESEKTAGCRLTEATDKNFEQIFDFGLDIFGLDQAGVYQTGMIMRFDKLVAQPMPITRLIIFEKAADVACLDRTRFTINLNSGKLSLSEYWDAKTLIRLLRE